MRLAALSLALVALSIALDVPPLPLNVTVVASGFSWIENLCFDGSGNMFGSERLRGQLLIMNGREDGEDGYITRILLDGVWELLLGCAVDERRHPGVVFVVGSLQNGSNVLAAIPVAMPGSWQIVAFTQHVGNGISIHEATGVVYTSTEADFLPGQGAVYSVDPSQPWGGPARVLATDLWAADGLWIDQDQGVLFVGLLFSAEVWVYSIRDLAVLGTYAALKRAAAGLPPHLPRLCSLRADYRLCVRRHRLRRRALRDGRLHIGSG
jgi:hypothetical protein